MPIVVITVSEPDLFNRRRHTLVASHGIDLHTGKSVVLPCEPPETLGAKFDPEMGEWVIPDDDGEKKGYQILPVAGVRKPPPTG